jgi:hypothetical protein
MIAFSLVLKKVCLYWCYPVTNFDKITIAAAADARSCMQRTLRFRILSQC